jgi:DnaJ-domain-containing protein 1
MTWLIYGALAYLIYHLYVSSRKGAKGQARPKAKAKRVREAPAKTPPAVQAKAVAPHEVLGVEPEASPEQIRRAYQKMMHEYHPDRVANAASELRQLAEKRSKEINAAYESMMRGLR